jgi:hypothetical protein
VITKDPTGTLNKYIFSEADLLKGKLLGPETLALLEHQATEIAETLLATKFSGDPLLREEQIMQFVYLQAKRETMIELLTDCSAEFARLAEAD